MQRKEALDVLALKPGASSIEIKEAYRDLVKVWHPDRFGSDPQLRQKAEDKLTALNEAYRVLQAGSTVKGADATPNPFVGTVIVLVLLLNVPDAPVEGAVNTTFAPDIGLVPASFTVTARAFAKAVLTVADCGVVPALAVMEATAPVRFVSEKESWVRPEAAAVTL